MSTTYEDLGLTNFPDSLDTFLTYLNITATDAPLIAQYQSAVESGDFTTAQNVLAQIPSYTQKLVKATDLNKIMQSILALERFFKTDIQSFVNQKQTEWEEIVGEFDYKGVYSSGTTYTANNVVTYTAGGLSMLYIATGNPPAGTSPSNTNYWRVLTIRGQQGPSGTGFSYRQAWQSNVNYVVNNAVSYDNILWGAIADSINQTPSVGSTYWKPILQFASTKYPIQPDEPTSQDVGDLWFNTTGTPEGIVELNPLSNPATAENILLNTEAYDDQGNLITGSMANNGAVSETLAFGGSYTIPQGYHNGQGKVNGPSLPTLSNPATAENIKSGFQALSGAGEVIEGSALFGETCNVTINNPLSYACYAYYYFNGEYTETTFYDGDFIIVMDKNSMLAIRCSYQAYTVNGSITGAIEQKFLDQRGTAFTILLYAVSGDGYIPLKQSS